ncbi:diguanylate cyclase [Pseudomonas sp. ICMP 8385]|uniref:putative bifunctional diguanylate cyclase/phosphodiesterase n=1 Tax=Pseudomonas sp. ICMP 8385 TaxID=1718920 RepID=UPI000C082D0C|nr:EAL domain-containing protein [Pseudomonas sp. ICMP 8385]PHN52807.1 diguanylate cyclase [Pseudomonas sp. ICMP 8385]
MSQGYRAAVDAAAIFSETDMQGNITYVNEQFCAISGYSVHELLGKNHRILNSSLHPPEFFAELWKTISSGKVWKGEICNIRKDGTLYWVESTIVATYDSEANVKKYVSIRFDVTEKRKLMEVLQWRADHDVLTGLPNRSLLYDRFKQSVATAHRNHSSLAVCILDLDGFKLINDRYGHAIGDRLLVEVSERLKKIIRGEDTVARLGGDEFVILLGLMHANELEMAMQRILTALSLAYTIDGIELNISASIGVTIYPKDDADIDSLLRHADQAMYRAKLRGRDCYHLFNILLDNEARTAFETVVLVSKALRNNELCLHYQPKINLSSGTITGYEALLRWQHPQEGIIYPQNFIPFVEQTNLIVDIGNWVIEQALTQISNWAALGKTWSVAVNIAALHFQREDFVETLKHLLSRFPNSSPQMLDIEIVESVMLENIPLVVKNINECKKLGVTFSLDDFGTGYSSLSYLKKLETHSIKIDQSFIRGILDDKNSLLLTIAIIGLAKSFNREVIAEGVETVEQAKLLMRLGCDSAQGYGFAKPMPVEAVISWSKHFSPTHLSLGPSDF